MDFSVNRKSRLFLAEYPSTTSIVEFSILICFFNQFSPRIILIGQFSPCCEIFTLPSNFPLIIRVNVSFYKVQYQKQIKYVKNEKKNSK